ncbi:N-acetylgalactosamine kinase isoform X1 [Fukomys damarensis]|uniref:N-acetylgalactosamine kinase isoform X1 n=1 Tax=Fukomys damarensis TaxID=885580 RepID=UPI001455B626|nr:N-acetylgalactosamine kinase isoform X1 [Fukomys damarensis]
MFKSKFGSFPKFYVRAPGRVNIIEQDMLIAVEPVKTYTLHLANTNPLYPDFSTSTTDVQIDKSKPLWHNYFLCGFKGVQEHFGLSNPTGMNCLVDGNVPPSSGLSSSSALVCCAGLVTLTVLGMKLSKVELAEICTKSERYIGTEGGGMDQSISFLAEEGTAKLIEFNPLRATDVKLPSGAVFVIANSCVEMNKAATSHFNIRVMECRLAAKLLAKHKSLPWDKVLRLEEVQAQLGISLEEMLLVTDATLHPEPYSPEEICRCLGISLEELRTQILSPNTRDVTVFKLYQRAKHVYSEAARVLQFRKVCEDSPEDAVAQLGELMNQSHRSCRDLYECSCPELDQLVDTCRAVKILSQDMSCRQKRMGSRTRPPHEAPTPTGLSGMTSLEITRWASSTSSRSCSSLPARYTRQSRESAQEQTTPIKLFSELSTVQIKCE